MLPGGRRPFPAGGTPLHFYLTADIRLLSLHDEHRFMWMRSWRIIALIIITSLYFGMVYLRLWLNQFLHLGINSKVTEFIARVRWETLRDLAILTIIYAALVASITLGARKR